MVGTSQSPLSVGPFLPGPSWSPAQDSGLAREQGSGGGGQGRPGSSGGDALWVSTTQGRARMPISQQKMQGRNLLGGPSMYVPMC